MKHVPRKRLMLFCEGEVSIDQAGRIEDHLNSCAECAAARDEIELSLKAMQAISSEPLPAPASERIQQKLRQSSAEQSQAAALAAPRVSVSYVIRVFPLVIMVLLGGWWFQQPRLNLTTEQHAAGEFERAAISGYTAYLDGRMRFDLQTSSATQARRWIRQQPTRFDAPLAVTRSPEEEERFRLQGLKVIPYKGKPALLVVYEIDSTGVVLLTAPASNIPDAPRSGVLSKSIHFSRDDKLKILSWKSAGEVYALVSDLPGRGMQSCFICHTDSKRERLIRKAEETH